MMYAALRVLQRAAHGITGIYFIAMNFGERRTRARAAVAFVGNNILHRFSIMEGEDAGGEKGQDEKKRGGGGRGRGLGQQSPHRLKCRAPEVKFTTGSERRRPHASYLARGQIGFTRERSPLLGRTRNRLRLAWGQTYEEAGRGRARPGEARLRNSPHLDGEADCNDVDATPRWVGRSFKTEQ